MKKLLAVAAALALFGATSAFAGDAVDINTADAQTLAATIKGVGTKKAEAIIAYRDKHGPFKSVDGLAQVRGVSARMIEASRSDLSVGTGTR